jgi:tetratricopeptide (TPR) repeat protein
MKVLPMLEPEPRCGRLDWERCSILVNIGNTFSRQGDYEKANEQYTIAEKLGREHIEADEGNKVDGMGIAIVAMRARAFALKKAGREEEGKKLLKEVIAMQIECNAETEKKKKEEEAAEKARLEAATKASAEAAAIEAENPANA